MTWIKNLLSEGDAVSSKRFIAILGSLTLLVMLIVGSFSPTTIGPSDGLVNAVLVLTLGCFGFTSVDKFARK
jgi:positive regulator of sigma E activity